MITFRFLSGLKKSYDNAYSPYTHVLTVHKVIMCINQLKGIYFPKVREIVEIISCQTNDATPVLRIWAVWSSEFSINL